MSQLRVLSFATLYPNDSQPGFGVFVERQMQAVVRRGDVDLTVVSPLGIPPFPLWLHARYRHLRALEPTEQRKGVSVLRPRFGLLPAFGARFKAATIAAAVLPLARQLHADRPFDLIDAQFFFPDGPAAVAVAQAMGLPVSIKARGSDIYHWGRDAATAEQVREAGEAADGLLAVAGGLAEDMGKLGIPERKITVHRTGIDADLFRPYDRRMCRDELGLPRDVPVLACVGALIPRKGQRFAIEALAMLPHAQLVFAGTGGDEAGLRALARNLGVAEQVSFLGAVPHGQLPVLLNAADVFVLPSESEGLANAWVEALACGTPVVTTPIPGARELITDPRWGRLVARDGAAIAAAVSELLAERPAPEAVREAVAGMSWEANAEALVNHWRRLAGKP